MAVDFVFPTDEYLLVGKITKPHGLRGEVKIFAYSGEPENIACYKELVLVDRSGTLSSTLAVVKGRVQGKTAVVQLVSIDNRTLAESIEGYGVLLARKDLPNISDDEYYWHQYQGKLVVDLAGKSIGQVDHLFSNGAQDILVVIDNGSEILIPVTKDIVVKESGGTIVINPPPGLLELNTGADD